MIFIDEAQYKDLNLNCDFNLLPLILESNNIKYLSLLVNVIYFCNLDDLTQVFSKELIRLGINTYDIIVIRHDVCEFDQLLIKCSVIIDLNMEQFTSIVKRSINMKSFI